MHLSAIAASNGRRSDERRARPQSSPPFRSASRFIASGEPVGERDAAYKRQPMTTTGGGSRADGLLDQIVAQNYPAKVRVELEACRRDGLPFDHAWRIATFRCPPAAHDFGSGAKGTGYGKVESPFDFMRRHFQAAYEGTEARRYCKHVDCVRLAVYHDECALHAEKDAAA